MISALSSPQGTVSVGSSRQKTGTGQPPTWQTPHKRCPAPRTGLGAQNMRWANLGLHTALPPAREGDFQRCLHRRQKQKLECTLHRITEDRSDHESAACRKISQLEKHDHTASAGEQFCLHCDMPESQILSAPLCQATPCKNCKMCAGTPGWLHKESS